MTTGSPASRVETTELVVPRSIPTALAMMHCLRVLELSVGWGSEGIRHDLRHGVSAGASRTLKNLECEGIKFDERLTIPRLCPGSRPSPGRQRRPTWQHSPHGPSRRHCRPPRPGPAVLRLLEEGAAA